MKILIISDQESKYYWDCYKPGMFDEFDLIISCGDLKPEYLSFIATFAHAPVLYVNGNHDGRNPDKTPEGCFCIEDKIFRYNGIRILGLGGSHRYNTGNNQYTQKEMKRRVSRLRLPLMINKGFDILVTHSPASGINDQKDIPHQGFTAFNDLLDKYKPKYFVHGHVHLNYGGHPRVDKYGETTIYNAYGKWIFEY
ncbi:MAG: metallophosphoesterase family protein [Oscillospiraceae bacterium]|nr:metallophosphoesterase family protein [Oscillospiraceae bacterium]